MTYRDHAGLCDAREAEAFHPPSRARWLDPKHHMLRRTLMLALTFAAGFAAALIVR